MEAILSEDAIKNVDYESIELIASGYEWTCLVCDADNTEISTHQFVQCVCCDSIFEVAEIFHAHD